jgi:hypothetical protein
MDFRTLHQVEDLLRMDLKIAQSKRESADLTFRPVSTRVSSPNHDGAVADAAMAQDVGRRLLLEALVKLNAFLTSGLVPHGLVLRAEVLRESYARAA